MKTLMDKIMLTCKQATFFISIRNFQKLKLVKRLQLQLHLMACTGCRAFNQQNRIIDKTLLEFHQNTQLQSEEELSPEKKSYLKSTVNQHTKK